ncbi:MAG: DUF3333 domain-containing protein, partial [Rhodobacteraceae bacterium]|nr:DUF3333 domain-containing protein [Paracoccaceae bacterium]
MTDATLNPSADAPRKGSLHAQDARTTRRNRAEARFKAYGITAIVIGLLFLVVLVTSIIRSGAPAFTHTVVKVDFSISQAQLDEAEGQLFKTKAYQTLFVNALKAQLDEKGLEGVTFDEAAIERLLGKVGSTIREYYAANPDQVDQDVSFELSASSRVDRYFNGDLTRDAVEDSRFLMKTDLDLADALAEAGIITSAFNWNFITGADSGVDN